MEENKKNQKEEIQSRREFFKNAAKGVLPILGAMLLAGSPAIVKAASKVPMGCSDDGCSYTCSTSCQSECRGYCKYGCSNTCKGTCSGSSR